MTQRILVTGGAGYIGSHTCLELLAAGFEVVALDNLSNSSRVAVERVAELAGRDLPFVEADIRDRAALDSVFRSAPFHAVIHFAGLKAVGESVEKPLEYFDNNVGGTVTLLLAMREAGVKTIAFSSSCTVYGDPASVPIREDFPVGAVTNPYGRSKLVVEQVLTDTAASTTRKARRDAERRSRTGGAPQAKLAAAPPPDDMPADGASSGRAADAGPAAPFEVIEQW